MLLVTLGYDANKAGLVGVNWAAKTNALADENGLLEDVNTSFTGPCRVSTLHRWFTLHATPRKDSKEKSLNRGTFFSSS